MEGKPEAGTEEPNRNPFREPGQPDSEPVNNAKGSTPPPPQYFPYQAPVYTETAVPVAPTVDAPTAVPRPSTPAVPGPGRLPATVQKSINQLAVGSAIMSMHNAEALRGEFARYVHEAKTPVACFSVHTVNKFYCVMDTIDHWKPWVTRVYGVYGGFITALLFFLVCFITPQHNVNSSWYKYGDTNGFGIQVGCSLRECCVHNSAARACYFYNSESGVRDPTTLTNEGRFATFCFLFAAILTTICSIISVAAWHKTSITQYRAWKSIASKASFAAFISSLVAPLGVLLTARFQELLQSNMQDVFTSVGLTISGEKLGSLWYLSAVASFCHGYWASACMCVLDGQEALQSIHSLVKYPILTDIKFVYDSMAEHAEDPEVLATDCMILHHIAASNEGKWAIRASGGIDRIQRTMSKFPEHARCQREATRALLLLD